MACESRTRFTSWASAFAAEKDERRQSPSFPRAKRNERLSDHHAGDDAAELGAIHHVLHGGHQPLPDRMDVALPALHAGSGCRAWVSSTPMSAAGSGRSSSARRSGQRFLFRHLRAKGVSPKAAAGCAYCGKGAWVKSNRPAMTRAYPPSWFAGRMASLKAPVARASHTAGIGPAGRWGSDRLIQRAVCVTRTSGSVRGAEE